MIDETDYFTTNLEAERTPKAGIKEMPLPKPERVRRRNSRQFATTVALKNLDKLKAGTSRTARASSGYESL